METLFLMMFASVIMLVYVWHENANTIRLQRQEIKQYRDAEDVRRGIGDHATCQECNMNIEVGRALCADCLRCVLHSGNH